jgi:hypothetical protein
MAFLNEELAAASSAGSNTELLRIAQLVGAQQTKSHVFSARPKVFPAASV